MIDPLKLPLEHIQKQQQIQNFGRTVAPLIALGVAGAGFLLTGGSVPAAALAGAVAFAAGFGVVVLRMRAWRAEAERLSASDPDA